MRIKNICIIFVILILLLVNSSCVDFYSISLSGDLKSENPYVLITLEDDPSLGGYLGEMALDDGSIIDIIVEFHHGIFGVFVYDSSLPMGLGEELLFGEYRQKGDTLVLYPENSDIITLSPLKETSK